MKRFCSSIEPLESRIAPAIFFVNGTNLAVTSSTGASELGVPTAATAVGATMAILLHAGDSLVYDLKGDHKDDSPADITFVKVTAGEAMAFFTDVNGSGKFDVSEFTGLAVGNGVKATINGAVDGSIDTLLDNTGSFTLTRQPASIAGLTIDGTVDGNIQAGGSISHVTFIVPKTGAQPFDLTGSILAGSTTSNSISLNGGGKTLSTSFAQVAGTAGGSISNLLLPRGLEGGINAGNGGNNTTGNGGTGGSVSHVTLAGAIGSTVFGSVYAGHGGNATIGDGQGGIGGSLSAISLTMANDLGDFTFISAGQGGNSANSSAGAGGAVSTTAVKVTGALAAGIQIQGGFDSDGGGFGGGSATGGAGGSVSHTSVTALDYVNGAIVIDGGAGGGNGSSGANGGAGGSVTSCSITAGSVAGDIVIEGGYGGPAKGATFTGGAGGAVTLSTVKVSGLNSSLYNEEGPDILGGHGGESADGNGGVGGSVSKSTISFNGTFAASNGGITMAGGAGGFVEVGGSGNGGRGGDVTGGVVSALGDFGLASINVHSGNGGNVGSTSSNSATGNGGDSGNVSGVTLTVAAANVGATMIYSGYGGYATGAGNGGSSGSVSKVTIHNLLDLAGNNQIYTGDGGAAGSAGSGGSTGSLSGIVVKDSAAGPPQYAWQFFTGVGGAGVGSGNHGGTSGNVSGVTFSGANASVVFGESDAAGSGTSGASGGSGGSISAITGRALYMSVLAHAGGSSDTSAAGAGGAVKGVTFTVGDFARLIAAGDGGSATTSNGAGTPGDGGSISFVKITGDIGDFQTAFDVDGASSGMGGLVAGLGGHDASGAYAVANNGKIANVSATRIAAIIAGENAGMSLDAYNAVLSITSLKTSFIGGDLNGNREFDWKSGTTGETGPGFALAPSGTNTDTPIDGLVIVATGGFAQSATIPLLSPGIVFFE